MMSVDKYRRIVDQLLRQTEKNALSWDKTAREGAFQVAFSEYTLLLYTVFNQDEDETDYYINILNDDGGMIDRFSDLTIRDGTPTWFKKMEQLYASARRQALGVDRALDDILATLERKS